MKIAADTRDIAGNAKTTYGSIIPSDCAAVTVFDSTVRVARRRIGIRYSLSAGNLRMPATGKLRLLFN